MPPARTVTTDEFGFSPAPAARHRASYRNQPRSVRNLSMDQIRGSMVNFIVNSSELVGPRRPKNNGRSRTPGSARLIGGPSRTRTLDPLIKSEDLETPARQWVVTEGQRTALQTYATPLRGMKRRRDPAHGFPQLCQNKYGPTTDRTVRSLHAPESGRRLRDSHHAEDAPPKNLRDLPQADPRRRGCAAPVARIHSRRVRAQEAKKTKKHR